MLLEKKCGKKSGLEKRRVSSLGKRRLGSIRCCVSGCGSGQRRVRGPRARGEVLPDRELGPRDKLKAAPRGTSRGGGLQGLGGVVCAGSWRGWGLAMAQEDQHQLSFVHAFIHHEAACAHCMMDSSDAKRRDCSCRRSCAARSLSIPLLASIFSRSASSNQTWHACLSLCFHARSR